MKPSQRLVCWKTERINSMLTVTMEKNHSIGGPMVFHNCKQQRTQGTLYVMIITHSWSPRIFFLRKNCPAAQGNKEGDAHHTWRNDSLGRICGAPGRPIRGGAGGPAIRPNGPVSEHQRDIGESRVGTSRTQPCWSVFRTQGTWMMHFLARDKRRFDPRADILWLWAAGPMGQATLS